MALERKDVRTAVDDEVHKALVIFAKISGVTVAEYVEKLIQADVSVKVSTTTSWRVSESWGKPRTCSENRRRAPKWPISPT
jgi:hypothetical protein